MINQSCTLPLEDLDFASNSEANSTRNPDGLLEAQRLSKLTAAKGSSSSGIFELCEGSFFTFPYKDEQTRTVCLKRVIFRSSSVFGRGTIVIRVECACRHCLPNQFNWQGKELVLKLTFPSETRVFESMFMDRCKELAQGEHAWVLNHLPNIYWSFDVPFHGHSSQDNFKKEFEDAHEMRVMRGSIQEELKPLSSLKTAKECTQVFCDIIQCHHWVRKCTQIFHRDVSKGNFMVRERDGKKYGVLNDWDLAIWINNEHDEPTSLIRTGTRPYMAHEQQSVHWKGPHRYRHDLESIFYVMLLLVCLYSNPNEKVPHFENEEFRFEEWHWRDDAFLRLTKTSVVYAAPFIPPVSPFFSDFLLWLTELQDHLYMGFYSLGIHIKQTAKQKHNQFDTDDDSLCGNLPAFDMETLGGYFSYERIGMLLHTFQNERLATHGLEWQKILKPLS
ncbi:hypothetical protein DFJ43DRAFT_1005246 [Lentinula guzmanii]|uniref:Protein kinase domain-containing protein n=1 Tax=Lentinula guzmanii TaxID=2804957 RepID=A0AA38MWD4_9AGAR|nr:hypothetical protein DFJ43DRAFT_1005246 [Lentinula guzmanii]